MSKNIDLVHTMWRWTILSLKLVLVMLIVVVGLNIWDDAKLQKPFNWLHFLTGFGFLLFACFLYAFMRLIYKLVLAKAKHDEHCP